MRVRVIAALAGVAVFSCGAAGSAQTTMAPAPAPAPSIGPTPPPLLVPPDRRALPPGPVGPPIALNARYLRGSRVANSYRLTGQALVKDACTAARFTQSLGNIFPPFFNVMQYRRPGTAGLLCILRPTWLTVEPLTVKSAAPPRYVTVHTQKGSARVPVLPGAEY
jgi:hypothetical protein